MASGLSAEGRSVKPLADVGCCFNSRHPRVLGPIWLAHIFTRPNLEWHLATYSQAGLVATKFQIKPYGMISELAPSLQRSNVANSSATGGNRLTHH
jgi:hypothetical protein